MSRISVRDQFIFGGHTHFWSILPESWIRCPNPASAENLAEWEGGLVHFFFLNAPESVLYFSIGLGVHEILQVIPAKIIDEQKNNK